MRTMKTQPVVPPVLAVSFAQIRAIHRVLDPFLKAWFRPQVRHIERVPAGPTMLVGNHDGGVLPIDAILLGAKWYEHHDFVRPLHVLMHDYPFRVSKRLTRFLYESGIVRASRTAIRDILDRGSSVLVYPGGDREAYRPFLQRKRADLGKRSGFVGEALLAGVPITPVASVGAHETLIVLSRGKWLAERLGLRRHFRAEVFPLVMGLPFGIWAMPLLPHFPLPAQVTVEVLPPVDLRRELGIGGNAKDAADPLVRAAGYELVHERIQTTLDRLYAQRKLPFVG